MDRLELLRYVSDDIYPTTKLDNVLLIACQHLLGTTYEMFEELFRKGLKTENTFLIGKCYSTHRGTYRKFEQREVHISPLSQSYTSWISFDEQFSLYIQNFLRNVLETVSFEKYERVIILDDGGHLLSSINSSLKDFGNVIGIEQTSSGYQRLLEIHLSFPVINVARSMAKLEVESPLIARITTERIERYLVESTFLNPKILIVGRGSIGRRLFDLLQEGRAVSVCDVLAEKCDFEGNYKEHLADFDIIIGTTGNTVIGPDEFRLLKRGATLISTSSSDREFSAVFLRELSTKTDNCHKDITVNGITLLNGGFPINFDGAEHSLPREHAQFTRALLLSALYECEQTQSKEIEGFVELKQDIQEKIIEVFSRI